MKKVLITLLLVAGCMSATAQWSENPEENNRITPKDMSIYTSEFKVTSDGITYYLFNRPMNGGNIATILQIIKKDGTLLFPEEGKIISQEKTLTFTVINDLLMVDKDNNALIAVHDCRNSSDAEEGLSYSIYKVSPEGEMLWGEKGIDIENEQTSGIEAAINMIQLEDGSYIFGWMANSEAIMGIKMQRRSTDGELLWSTEVKDDKIPHEYPFLMKAGNNQFYLVYVKGSNKDITVKKLDFDGTEVWPQDTRVYRGGFPNVPLQIIIKVAYDPNGGVFIGWYDDRSFTNKESTFVSYVTPSGALAFSKGEEGEQVGYSDLRSFSPRMVYDQTENCLYVIWRETTGNQTAQRIMAQKMAMTGELMWDLEGIEVAPLSSMSTAYYSIQQAINGDFTAFYMLKDEYSNTFAHASRINKDGNPVWESPVVFASRMSEKSELKSSQLIENSYWLTLWEDFRKFSENEPRVGKTYMQKVNIDGTLTASSIYSAQSNARFAASPVVMEESTLFTFENEKTGPVNLSIYNLSGQKIAIVYNGQRDKGIQEISWSPRISSGVYIATLTTADSKQSIRIIVK